MGYSRGLELERQRVKFFALQNPSLLECGAHLVLSGCYLMPDAMMAPLVRGLEMGADTGHCCVPR